MNEFLAPDDYDIPTYYLKVDNLPVPLNELDDRLDSILGVKLQQITQDGLGGWLWNRLECHFYGETFVSVRGPLCAASYWV